MNSTDGTNTALDWSSMPEWITSSEAAEVSGYDVQWICRLTRAGKIGAERKSRDWWIDRDKFHACLAAMTELGNKRHDPRGIPDVTND